MNYSEESILSAPSIARVSPHPTASKRLVSVIQSLSRARDLPSVMEIVRVAARELTGCDGATFVLRDGNYCYYADEDSIHPLWKGKRFPIEICISGWVMIHKSPVIIPDVFEDPRIPMEAYRPTFVKSLAMVPIRSEAPMGAIGNYWSYRHEASAEQIEILQALADSTAVALENVQLYSDLKAQNEELEQSNRELKRLAWAASHDLKEPVRAITTHLQLIEKKAKDKLDESSRDFLSYGVKSALRLHHLVEDIFSYSRLDEEELHFAAVAADAVLSDVLNDLKLVIEESGANVRVAPLPVVFADISLLRRVLQNLISNAVKFRRSDQRCEINIDAESLGAEWIFRVKDNGIGVENEFGETIFGFLTRVHSSDQYPGSGIGLAISKRIIEKHRGRIWVESGANGGSCFCFTLPRHEIGHPAPV